jgi:hypothetical protein
MPKLSKRLVTIMSLALALLPLGQVFGQTKAPEQTNQKEVQDAQSLLTNGISRLSISSECNC